MKLSIAKHSIKKMSMVSSSSSGRIIIIRNINTTSTLKRSQTAC